jgi:hypothetical protein
MNFFEKIPHLQDKETRQKVDSNRKIFLYYEPMVVHDEQVNKLFGG